jgi:hypothetical protein
MSWFMYLLHSDGNIKCVNKAFIDLCVVFLNVNGYVQVSYAFSFRSNDNRINTTLHYYFEFG